MGKRFTPIIVGVGDVKNRSTKVEDAVEPAQLMLDAIKLAIKDTQLPPNAATELRSTIDSIDVVKTWTWPYTDLPGLLAERTGFQPKHKVQTEHGGNQPAKRLDEASRRISTGETKAALLTGGEALASLTACAAAKKLPPRGWTTPSESVESVFSPTSRSLGSSTSTLPPAAVSKTFTLNHHVPGVEPILMSLTDLGARHSIGAPIHVYPLYENGFRAHRGQNIRENHRESASLYADFSQIAAVNDYAWGYGKADTEENIGKAEGRNRMICFPYPLLMNAFNTVNLAAAVLLTSTDYAQKLGIPQEKWIYPLSGAGTQDGPNFWERPNFHTSPSLSRSIDAALDLAGLRKDDIDYFDFYSCFPIVPKLACNHLGLSIDKPAKPITLLGGLTSFGGAGNNYSMHSITAVTRQLRRRGNSQKAEHGLVLANGGFATYQHVLIFSSHPPSRPDNAAYPLENPLPYQIDDIPAPPVVELVGPSPREAVVETYTVEFDRSNKPLRGHVVGRLKGSGERFLANHADQATLDGLSSLDVEPVGRKGRVWSVESETHAPGAERRNVFSFEEPMSEGPGGRQGFERGKL